MSTATRQCVCVAWLWRGDPARVRHSNACMPRGIIAGVLVRGGAALQCRMEGAMFNFLDVDKLWAGCGKPVEKKLEKLFFTSRVTLKKYSFDFQISRIK